MVDLVVGVDVGGTTTRCVLVSCEGAIVSTGTGGGASIRSSAGMPAEKLEQALRSAISPVQAQRVCGGVFGIAGSGTAAGPAACDAATAAWRAVGLAGEPRVVTDLEVAFAAGTSSPDGLLLLAGTGAAAAAFSRRLMVRRCDGYGWLLGDDGSAVWLGLRGIRAALDAYDGRGPATRLRDDVAARFGLQDDFAQGVIAAVHARAPAHLGELAPLVTRAADAGDAVAAELVRTAADRLVAAVRAVRAVGAVPAGATELVLAGSLLLADGPLGHAVRERVAAEHADLRLRDASSGAVGAAALALAELVGGSGRHEALLRAPATPARSVGTDESGVPQPG